MISDVEHIHERVFRKISIGGALRYLSSTLIKGHRHLVKIPWHSFFTMLPFLCTKFYALARENVLGCAEERVTSLVRILNIYSIEPFEKCSMTPRDRAGDPLRYVRHILFQYSYKTTLAAAKDTLAARIFPYFLSSSLSSITWLGMMYPAVRTRG